MQGVSKTDFEKYVKANDAVLRNMQNQGQGSLPSNMITNPKEDLKGITTRSGVVYQGPTIPTSSSPKVVERRTKVTKDTVFLLIMKIPSQLLLPLVRRCLTQNRRFLILQGEMMRSAVKTLTNKLRNSTKYLKI
ncbi:hypothetical protein Tco_0042068 [Tanacetum coccineum]